jgi:uncharacterized membrane protein
MKRLAASLALFLGLAPSAQAAFEICNRNFDRVQIVVAMVDRGQESSKGWYTLKRDECETFFTRASASFYYRVSGPNTPGTKGTRAFCISQDAFNNSGDDGCALDGMFEAEYMPARLRARSSDGKKGSSSAPVTPAAFVIPKEEVEVSLMTSMMAYRSSYVTPEFWRASGDWDLYKLALPSGDNSCFAIKEFSDGTVLRIGRETTSPDLWHFHIGNAEWTSLEKGTSYELKAKLTKRWNWTLSSTGMSGKAGWPVYLGHRFADDSSLLPDIKNGSTFSIEYKGKRIANPSLRGSTKAVNAVNECMSTFGGSTGGRPKSGGSVNDPFAD